MSELLIGPLTRENTPVAVQVRVESGKITDAKIMGRHIRGFEYMLKGLEPMDAPYFTERICGICSTAHGYTSCLALENAASTDITKNAVLMRNIIFVGDLLQNHLRHFYLLALPDFVHLPEQPPWIPRHVHENRLSKAETERITNNYFRSFEISREAHTLAANFGGRAPHNWSIQPGGVSVQPTAERIMRAKANVKAIQEFITQCYAEDLQTLVEAYPEYREYGYRPRNYIAYGSFPDPDNPSGYLYEPGVVLAGEEEKLDVKKITESVEKSWYSGEKTAEEGPFFAEHPKLERDKKEAYSFIKSARYQGYPCEGGPIVRAYLSGGYRRGNATWDRHLARQWEAAEFANKVWDWFDQLEEEQPAYTSYQSPYSGKGEGLFEAMRGPLGHWIEIDKGKIKNYTVITPSVWNMGPGINPDDLGPIEQALIGTPIEDIENPVEVGRVVRAFDPCTACAVHVLTPTRKLEPIRII